MAFNNETKNMTVFISGAIGNGDERVRRKAPVGFEFELLNIAMVRLITGSQIARVFDHWKEENPGIALANTKFENPIAVHSTGTGVSDHPQFGLRTKYLEFIASSGSDTGTVAIIIKYRLVVLTRKSAIWQWFRKFR